MPNEVEQINPTTYRIRFVEDEVEIGDIGAPTFIPHAKLKRWGVECFLDVKPAGVITEIELTVEQYKLKSKYKVTQNGFDLEIENEFEGFPPDAQNSLGAFEFNIILAKKPPTNRLVFDIEVQGLVFYYQPPLTQEYQDGWSDEFGTNIIVSETQVKDAGTLEILVERPENVVGSYAVYHATKQGHVIGQTNYMAGKAFHIYRPRIEDAAANWVWGELAIDTQAGTLTVTIPQDFLDTATYPIRHAAGATFGHTGEGVSNHSKTADVARATGDVHTGAAGTGTSMSLYAKNNNDDVKMALYKDSDDTLVGDTDPVALGAAAAWKEANFVVPPAVAAIDYILAFKSNATIYVYYDSGAVNYVYAANAFGAAWPAPTITWSNGVGAFLYSIYCTYTPAAAGGGGGAGGLAAAAAALLT